MKRFADLLAAQAAPAPAAAAEPLPAPPGVVQRRAVPDVAPPLPSLHPVLQRIYAARGIRDAAQLKLTLDRLLPVSSLPGVEAAARLLLAHRERRIVVVGDFDADGATSTALHAAGTARPGDSRTWISWCPTAFASATA